MQIYTDILLPPWLGGIKLSLRSIILVDRFHYDPLVLESWVIDNIETFRREFVKKSVVTERVIHLPNPVLVNSDYLNNLNVEELRPLFTHDRVYILIYGEGGVGKTSLACQIAKWAMSENINERLCERIMLPVLIEPEFSFKVSDTTSSQNAFIDAIHGHIDLLTGVKRPVTQEFIKYMLRYKYILVIVDHLSGMTNLARELINPGYVDFYASALIVTSRDNEYLNGIPKTTIQPLRIEGSRLAIFIEEYLERRDKRHLFKGAEYFDAFGRLSAIVGAGETTVLLAKLYIERLISMKEGLSQGELPKNVPDIMLSYINELNREFVRTEFNNRTVHLDIMAIAWESLRQYYRPIPVKRSIIISVLQGDNAYERINHLENRLHIIHTVTATEEYIRFSLDPIAEYFAGLYLVSLFGNNEELWYNFLMKIDHTTHRSRSTQDFLSAVLDCCLAIGSYENIPNFVVGELSQIIKSLSRSSC